MAGSFAEAAEAAQRVLTAAQRDGAPPADEEGDEGEDLSVAAAAVLLQARRYLDDSPAALRALLEAAFASLRAVPPEALLLWCAPSNPAGKARRSLRCHHSLRCRTRPAKASSTPHARAG